MKATSYSAKGPIVRRKTHEMAAVNFVPGPMRARLFVTIDDREIEIEMVESEVERLAGQIEGVTRG
jgi:hypothetical protein